MRTVTTVTINNNTYEIGMIPADRSIEILYDLSKYTSVPLGKLGNTLAAAKPGTKVMDMDIGEIDFAGALQSFFENCPKKDFISTLKELCTTNITRNGKHVNFSIDFMGNQGEAFMLAAEVLRFNFSDFFTVAREKLGFIKTAMSERLTLVQ